PGGRRGRPQRRPGRRAGSRRRPGRSCHHARRETTAAEDQAVKILVTGSRGKVGAATVSALLDAGHEVTASDLGAPVFERGAPGVAYKRADLTDAGDAFAVVRGHDAVIHSAAIPDPQHHPAHTVFSNNVMATF